MANAVQSRSPFSRLAARLPIGLMGRAFHACGTISSTQDELRRFAEAGAPEGTLVVAEHQTRGRGRMGRTWLDEPGANLLASVLFRPEIPGTRVPQLSLLAAVACAEAVRAVTHLAVGIRWPNDLQVRERKVGGILAEGAAMGRQVSYVILGIGINVNQTEFPAGLPMPATSLALEAGQAVDRQTVLEALLVSLDRWYTRYREQGFAPVREEWRRAATTLGRWINGGGVTGVAEDMDLDGALLVRTGAGDLARLIAGELR